MRVAVGNTKLVPLADLELGAVAALVPIGGRPIDMGLVLVVNGGDQFNGKHFVPLSGDNAFFIFPVERRNDGEQYKCIPYDLPNGLSFELAAPIEAVEPTYSPGALLLRSDGTYIQCRHKRNSHEWSRCGLDVSDWTLKEISFDGIWVHPWKLLTTTDGREAMKITSSPALIED